MISIQIKFFGSFRQFGNGEKMVLLIDSAFSVTVAQLKEQLKIELTKIKPENMLLTDLEELIAISVIANENEILSDSCFIQNNDILAILPPVCGG